MTTTRYGSLPQWYDFLVAYAGEYADEYDLDAIRDEVEALVNQALPDHVVFYGNGDIDGTYPATPAPAIDGEETSWMPIAWSAYVTSIIEDIDLAPIFQGHTQNREA